MNERMIELIIYLLDESILSSQINVINVINESLKKWMNEQTNKEHKMYQYTYQSIDQPTYIKTIQSINQSIKQH